MAMTPRGRWARILPTTTGAMAGRPPPSTTRLLKVARRGCQHGPATCRQSRSGGSLRTFKVWAALFPGTSISRRSRAISPRERAARKLRHRPYIEAEDELHQTALRAATTQEARATAFRYRI